MWTTYLIVRNMSHRFKELTARSTCVLKKHLDITLFTKRGARLSTLGAWSYDLFWRVVQKRSERSF